LNPATAPLVANPVGAVAVVGGSSWFVGRWIGGLTPFPGSASTIDDAVTNLFDSILNENTSDSADAEPVAEGNTNPYSGPVTEDVTVVDSNGNAIPVNEGESITTSPDGEYQQVRDKDGNKTGVRKDGAHKSHKQEPHAHRPDVDVPGNDNLPIRQ